MKYLQRITLLFGISLAIFSCQKEYSVENNTGVLNNTAQWSFTEGSLQFKGPIDTVTIDTSGGYKFLTVNGHSTDKKDLITLQVFGTDVKAGTYKTPFSLFAYLRNGVLLYQTNQTAVDSFTIVITKLDSTGITGTFSGKAYDSTKTYKTIVDGKFAYVFKSSTPATPVSTDSGNVVLWSKAGCGGGTSTNPISVSVGTKAGQITKFVASEPSACDSTGGFSVKLPVGTYPVVAKCGTDSITGTVTIAKNTCTKLQVDFSTPVVASDYFPTTKNSNWSYVYENSTPDDTLYIFSTGLMGKITGLNQTYSLFTSTDGSTMDSSFYRKAGNAYYTYIPAQHDSSNGGTDVPGFEYTFLKDNLATGASYTDGPVNAQVGGLSGTVTLTTTILDKPASVVIGGNTYKDVIKVKTVYSFKYQSINTSFYAAEQWFAKGVGLIKYIDYETAPFSTPTNTLDITRVQVY